MNPANKFSLSPRLIATLIYYFLPLLFVAVAVYFIPVLYHLILMFFISFFISHLFFPPVNYLERHGFTRHWATLLVFLIIFVILINIIGLYSPLIWNQLMDLQNQLAHNDIMEFARGYFVEMENYFVFLPEGSFSGRIGLVRDWILQQLSGALVNLYIFLQYLIIVPFISFFLVRDKRLIRRCLVQGVSNAFFEMVFNIYYKIDQKVGQYIRGLIIEAIIIAILCIIGLMILGVPYAIIIGIFAGIANIVPYFGPIAGAIPAIVIKSLETTNITSLVAVGLLFLIVQSLDNIWLKPHVFARSMNMHPLVVFLVVIAGGELAGIMGMVLSIPLTASIGVILREFYRGIKDYQFQS